MKKPHWVPPTSAFHNYTIHIGSGVQSFFIEWSWCRLLASKHDAASKFDAAIPKPKIGHSYRPLLSLPPLVITGFPHSLDRYCPESHNVLFTFHSSATEEFNMMYGYQKTSVRPDALCYRDTDVSLMKNVKAAQDKLAVQITFRE